MPPEPYEMTTEVYVAQRAFDAAKDEHDRATAAVEAWITARMAEGMPRFRVAAARSDALADPAPELQALLDHQADLGQIAAGRRAELEAALRKSLSEDERQAHPENPDDTRALQEQHAAALTAARQAALRVQARRGEGGG